MAIEETYEGDVDQTAIDSGKEAAETLLEDQLAKDVEEEDSQDQDLSAERYGYTLEDGTEIEGTIQEIAEKIAASQVEARVAEALAKATPAEKPTEKEKPETKQAQAEDVLPVDWTQTGDLLATKLGIDPADMSDSERKTLGEIGPMMNDAIHRTFFTSPYIAQVIGSFVGAEINKALSNKETAGKRVSAFKQFVGEADFKPADIAAFQKDNPWAETKEMAILGLKMQADKQGATTKTKEIEKDVKGKTAEAVAKALATKKKAGELRLLGGSNARAGASTDRKVLKGDDRTEAAVARLHQMRSAQ